MSWKWEMCDNGKWITNAVRFATKEEAEKYGFDLGMRWMGMPDPARAAESDDLVNYRIVDNKVEPIVQVLSLDDPSVVHNAIKDALGE